MKLRIPLFVRATWPPLLIFSLFLMAAFSAAFLLPEPLWWIACGGCGLGAGIMLCDALGRWEDCKALRGFGVTESGLRLFDWRLKYDLKVYTLQQSWCGRAAAVAAEPALSGWFYEQGYRWYHIFPDHAFTRHSPFLKMSFWRGVMCFWSGHKIA